MALGLGVQLGLPSTMPRTQREVVSQRRSPVSRRAEERPPIQGLDVALEHDGELRESTKEGRARAHPPKYAQNHKRAVADEEPLHLHLTATLSR